MDTGQNSGPNNDTAPGDKKNEAAANKTLLKTAGIYAIIGANGQEQERGAAKIIVKEEEISFLPENGKVLNVAMREISEAAGENYAIRLTIAGGAGVEISQLGYQYDDFWRAFWEAKNAISINDLLMKEPGDLGKARARAIRAGNDLGECDIQFYETSLLVMPRGAEIFKINYGDIDGIAATDFKIILTLDEGDIEFGMMGERFGDAVKIINGALTKISMETQEQIKQMLPDLDSLAVRQMAELMKDGRCAAKSKVEALSAGAWPKIEKFMETAGIKESYDNLKKLAGPEAEAFIGIKRAMMGGLAGDYVWFLMPLEKDNAIAMEATGQGGSGKATYFFRLAGRAEFVAGSGIEQITTDKIVNAVQKCVKRINFRREPIYLPEEKLNEPRYWKYKFILGKIPEIDFLRSVFIGRVCHRSNEQWQKDARELLDFNISQKDNSAKWKAADDDLDPEPETAPGQNNQTNNNITMQNEN